MSTVLFLVIHVCTLHMRTDFTHLRTHKLCIEAFVRVHKVIQVSNMHHILPSRTHVTCTPDAHLYMRISCTRLCVHLLHGASVHRHTCSSGDIDDGWGHTAICTDAGQLYIFGIGSHGHLGHGDRKDEWLPRLVQELVGTKVVTAVWTAQGGLFVWGMRHGLGHGNKENQLMPQLVEGLADKMMVGAAVGTGCTAAWTEAGELCALIWEPD